MTVASKKRIPKIDNASTMQPVQMPTSGQVHVRVQTDIEQAELVVNGQMYGPISVGDAMMLKFSPGEHRFEVHADGELRVHA